MSILSVNTATTAVPTPRQTAPDSTISRHASTIAESTSEPTPATQSSEVTPPELDQAVKAVNEFVRIANSSLEFSVDEETGIELVRVIDKETEEVIRQIPSEEIVAIAKALNSLKGLLIHQKA